MRARSFGLLLLALCGAGAGAEPAHRRLGRERGRRRAKARVNRGPSKRWERQEGASEDGVPLCEDTCASARNGVCEDGSLLMRRLRINQDGVTRVPGTVSRLLCDLGTDCADCGPSPPLRGMASLAAMMPAARPSPAPRPAPHPETDHRVAYLRSRSVEVRAAWTLTQPAFIMPFTDPRDDFDVSRAMQEKRVVEPLYNVYWSRLSRQCCADGGLMLDVGSNFGYYALYAAKLGCRVVAWEPVPVFRAFVEAGAALNNLSHRIHLRPAVVSDSAGEVLNMTVPEHGIWGTASVGGLNVDPSIRSKTYSVPASTETLDQMVAEAACIMKLDVEGFEPQVLKGAAETLRRRPPRAILTEYTPGVMERARKWDELARYPESLRTFAKAGCVGRARALLRTFLRRGAGRSCARWRGALTRRLAGTRAGTRYGTSSARTRTPRRCCGRTGQKSRCPSCPRWPSAACVRRISTRATWWSTCGKAPASRCRGTCTRTRCTPSSRTTPTSCSR